MIHFQENVTLHDKCSFKIGGKAYRYFAPKTVEQLRAALSFAEESNLEVLVLGRGTNLLISDYGWRGLVLDMTNLCTIIRYNEGIYTHAGTLLHSLVTHAVCRGFGGIEQLAGIPGTIGGGVIMNAGAFDQTISDNLIYVDAVEPKTGELMRFEKKQLKFEYRSSNLRRENQIVVGACFSLPAGDRNILKSSYREILRRRRSKQPLNLPNCGSVFKRPPGSYAGSLIEQCGLKGFRVGGAMISTKHANFIVNDNGAIAEDVRMIIAAAQKRVYEQTGILLEPEVIFKGDFQNPLYKPEKENSVG